MRILHTADWHVGKTLHRRQRLDECRSVLREITTIAEEEQVDLVLVCGDVYDQFAPSAEAEAIVNSTLLNLQRTGAAVLVLAGNHDNAKRLAAIEPLLAAVNVHAIPDARRPDQGGILDINDRAGNPAAQVAVLPWVSERLLFGAEEMMGLQAEPNQAYAEKLPRLIEALCAPLDPERVTILASHLFCQNAKVGGGERDLTIGDLFAVTAAALPPTVQYVALGHVHRPQDVPASPVPARYAGSPLQLDFGELDQTKSVTIIEVGPGKPAQVRPRELTCGRQLLDVHGTLEQLRHHDSDPDREWLRVTLECEGPSPGLAEEIREVLPNALEVRLDYERQDEAALAAETRGLSPRELFDRYFTARHGSTPDGRLTKLFDELLEEVQDAAPGA